MSGWLLGVQRTLELTVGMHFPPKITFWVLMLGSSYYGFWHIKIYLGPPRSTCIVAFIFLSLLSFSNICYLIFQPQHVLRSDLMEIQENPSHFDSTLLQVAFRNTFVFLDTMYWYKEGTWFSHILEHQYAGMALVLDEPYDRDQISCWLVGMAINLLAQLPSRRKEKQDFTRAVNIPYGLG